MSHDALFEDERNGRKTVVYLPAKPRPGDVVVVGGSDFVIRSGIPMEYHDFVSHVITGTGSSTDRVEVTYNEVRVSWRVTASHGDHIVMY